MRDIEELVRGLLERAWEDIESAEILYENGKKHSAMLHLEQASEKILKAYFLGFLINPLDLIWRAAKRAGVPERFRKIHQLVTEAVTKYSKPRHLGHDFDAFLNKFLPKLFEGICGGELGQYFDYSIKKGLILELKSRRNEVVARLEQEGLTHDQAVNLFDVFIEFLSSYPSMLLREDIREKLCKSDEVRRFHVSLKDLKAGEEPCLRATIEFYNFVNEVIDKAYSKVVEEKRAVFKEIADKLNELADILDLPLLKKSAKEVEHLIYSWVKGYTVVYMSLPLHYCLVRYYNVSRYPEDEIPSEEFAAIPQVIKVLKELHQIVSDLVL